MRQSTLITRLFLVATVSCSVVSCSGDARPLEEAVEANEQNLAGLEILPPPRSLDELFISTGEEVVFRLRGVSTAGNPVSVSADNRRWTVKHTGTAQSRISDNGVLVGEAEGLVEVGVRVGGIGATFNLEISDAPLTEISAINGPANFLELRGCEPVEFSAEGIYGGNGRTLRNTSWEVLPPEIARTGLSVDGVVDVIGLNPGMATLTATEDGVSGSRDLVVNTDLQTIAIAPASIGVRVGETRSLSAIGNYSPSMPATGVITESVDWRIVAGESFATLSNSGSSKGQLTGVAAGSVTLEAGCGMTAQTAIAIVSESSTNLSFDQDSPFLISVDGQERQLNVSTGTTYSEDRDVTASAAWTVADGNQFVTVGNDSSNKGLLSPIAPGEATVEATFNDETISITVEVF